MAPHKKTNPLCPMVPPEIPSMTGIRGFIQNPLILKNLFMKPLKTTGIFRNSLHII
jgi:hypothetical protein